MIALKNFSIFWSLSHTLVLFLLLFESRYPRKKTVAITMITMTPLVIANCILAFILDAETMGTLLLLTLTFPSLIVFWILAKNRDGRFLFTFCLVDTVVLEIIYISQIINHFTTPDTYIVMFIVRLVAYPLLEWLIYQKIRSTLLSVQRNTKTGWYLLTAISAIFYILLTLMMNRPTAITSRPEYLPAAVLLFILIPVIYIHIIVTLRRQQKMHDKSEQDNLLELQVNNMSVRMAELSAADERFREERHNYRHKMKTIATLVENEQYEELATLVNEYTETFKKTQVVRYSQNAVIDAVFSTYIKNAESKGIRVTLGLAFPDPIPVDEPELATVFANAIENAIHACEKLEPEKRFIDIKVLDRPRFMIRIANSFDGTVEFDENGIPVNRKDEHGFGTRSIAAFCKKHDAHYIFKADGERFTLYLNF